MSSFEDIGFLLMNVAKTCNVDAARIVTGDAIAASLAGLDNSGFHLVGSEPFQTPDGTPAQLLLLSVKPRRLSGRERATLRAMTLQAQTQLLDGQADLFRE